MTVKLYIFDMGGVVVQNSDIFYKIFDYLNISENEFYQYSGTNIDQVSDGKITIPQFWQLFSERSGIPVSEDLFIKFFHPTLDREVVQLITELKHTARVVCGTNTLDSHYQYHIDHEEYAAFDEVYASNKIGISKPNPGFFRYILEKENISPGESCFIDDMPENVAAADKLGIKALRYTGVAALRDSLKKVLK